MHVANCHAHSRRKQAEQVVFFQVQQAEVGMRQQVLRLQGAQKALADKVAAAKDIINANAALPLSALVKIAQSTLGKEVVPAAAAVRALKRAC